jgi:hypothetical protein
MAAGTERTFLRLRHIGDPLLPLPTQPSGLPLSFEVRRASRRAFRSPLSGTSPYPPRDAPRLNPQVRFSH